jgi:hypothetical protein
MSRLYEFTNGTTTFMVNMEHVTSIVPSSGDGVIISMINGATYGAKIKYDDLKTFLEKQSGIFITETVEKNHDTPF